MLRHVGRLKPASLTFTVTNSIPYDLLTYESTLRRYLSLPQTVFKQMVQKAGMLRSEEYAREFLNILRKDGNRTKMYENVDGYLKETDKQFTCTSFSCMEIILTNIIGLLWLICW